jgi:hypothetical protein
MKKVIIDNFLYTITNKEFEELNNKLAILELSSLENEMKAFKDYVEYCKSITSSRSKERKVIQGKYSTVM